MKVVIKASFDAKRSREVALELAEFIKTNANFSDSLEVQMQQGLISLEFVSASDKAIGFVDVKNILELVTEVENFTYNTKREDFGAVSVSFNDEQMPGTHEETQLGEITKDDNTEEGESADDSQSGRKIVAGNPKSNNSVRRPSVKSEVLKILLDLPEDSEGVNANYIAEILGIERRQAACHLTSLLMDGKVVRVSRGMYKVKSEDASDNSSHSEETETVTDAEDTEGEKKTEGTTTDKAEKSVPKIPSEESATKNESVPPAVVHTGTGTAKETETKAAIVIPQQKNFKRFDDLTEVKLFANLDSEIDFSLTREENVERVLSHLYDTETPGKGISIDLFTRSVVAVTIVPESIRWETIDSNLEDYDTGISEESKKNTEKYLINVFNKFGYTTTYIRFLKALNELFRGKYKKPDWPFPEKRKADGTSMYTRIKVEGIPENEEFETFLGRIVLMKAAGPKIMEKVVDYMVEGTSYNPKELSDIYELFRIAYSLKKINQDYLLVNGNFNNPHSVVETAAQSLVNHFIRKISPDEVKHIRYTSFLRDLVTAIRKAQK